MSQPKRLRDQALSLLARREHSRAELRRKLERATQDGAPLEALLDDLTRRGLLSEARFAEQLVHSKQGKYGARKIAYELHRHGVAAEIAAAALAEVKRRDVETARAVWQKKFGVPPDSAAARSRQIRFLQARGFGAEAIRRVVGGSEE